MKNLTVSILFIFSQMITWAQCPPGDLMFTSQSQIDEFSMVYPDCHEFDGSIIITGTGITNLNGLGGLTSIGGDLSFLYVSGLTNMLGLNNLANVGGSVIILESYTLNNLMGLNCIATIGGELTIYNNPNLKRINALDSLAYVGYNLTISNNGALTSIPGMNNLSAVGGDFVISDNPLLDDIAGLYNLTSISGGFFIEDSEEITNLGGLDNLTAIGGDFAIRFNSMLNDLSALQNLNAVGGELTIRSNYALESLYGLDNIDPASIHDLTIYNNNSLSTCEVLSICQYLASPGGNISITNNATGCDSPAEVEQACEWVSVEEPDAQARIEIYPNPASSAVTVHWPNITEKDAVLSLLNISGQEVLRHELSDPTIEVDISHLETGIYILRLQSAAAVSTRKLIVN